MTANATLYLTIYEHHSYSRLLKAVAALRARALLSTEDLIDRDVSVPHDQNEVLFDHPDVTGRNQKSRTPDGEICIVLRDAILNLMGGVEGGVGE